MTYLMVVDVGVVGVDVVVGAGVVVGVVVGVVAGVVPAVRGSSFRWSSAAVPCARCWGRLGHVTC